MIGIFGLGYTGRRIFLKLQNEFHQNVIGFSKNTKINHSERIDLSTKDSIFVLEKWKNQFESILITIPIQIIHSEFLEVICNCSPHVILLGTTSIFVRENNTFIINEKTTKNQNHVRFLLEKKFLELNGKIIYLSGIYGKNRNPFDWIIKGKVEKSRRQVNFIHIDDIVNVVSKILIEKVDLPELILSDEMEHSWFDIYNFLEKKNLITLREEEIPKKENQMIQSLYFKNIFPNYKMKDFWEGLGELNY